MSWDAAGAREDGLFDYEIFMATYGDSFAAGEEVNNDETWQYFLSRHVGKRALNSGTSGYGTDQVLMKIEVPYGSEDGHTLGFKPRFFCSSTLIVEPNPLVPFSEDPAQLRRLAERLVDVDAYARKKLRFKFPYTLRLAQLRVECISTEIWSWFVVGSRWSR